MANSHVEIHDPFSDVATSSSCAPKSTSDSDSMADTVEFRLLMAYANRRRPKRVTESPSGDGPATALNANANSGGPPSPETPTKTIKEGKEQKGRRKKRARRLLGILACIKPRTKAVEPVPPFLGFGVTRQGLDLEDDAVQEDDMLEDVVRRLKEIGDELPLTPPELQFDSEDDDVEKAIGLLLREAGDRLNQQELIDAGVVAELLRSYSFYETLMRTLLTRMGLVTPGPNALGPRASPITQIAVTCEVTSRLSTLDTLPMSRMLDHGARYLQLHYSPWAQQHGGYAEAFYSDDEDDEAQ